MNIAKRQDSVHPLSAGAVSRAKSKSITKHVGMLLPLSVCIIPFMGIQQAVAAPAPTDVTGLVYSNTAAEIFWPRVDGQVVAYVVSRDDEELGEFDALSFFDDTLEPGNRYVYSVASVDADGTRSDTVSTEIVINGVATDNQQLPMGGLAPPINVTQTIYSTTATEFFWDRADTAGLVYDITLNGELLGNGSTDGISTYVDSLDPGAAYTFSVVAVEPDTTTRSEPVQISFQMPVDENNSDEGDEPADEPFPATAVDTTLANVLRIINTNAHDRIKADLFAFDVLSAIPASGLTAQDINADTTAARMFDCDEGGTLSIEPQGSTDAEGNFSGRAVFRFLDCQLGQTLRNGNAIISEPANYDEGATFVYSGYIETQIAANPKDNVTITIPNGIVENGEAFTGVLNRNFMATPLLYTLTTRAGVENVKDLQRFSVYRDGEDPQMAVEFNTDFEVQSFWTSGNVINVDTTVKFSNVDPDTGLYTVGTLVMATDTIIEATSQQVTTGDSIELNADTGDARTYLLTVTVGDAVMSELQNWADLDEALPCPITANSQALQQTCR